MARPKLLGVSFAKKADPVRASWLADSKRGDHEGARAARAMLKSLATFETRANANSYCIMSGTSMATPYVAGVVGLMKTRNPSWTHSTVQSQLKSTALDLGTAGEDDTFGAGRIRANLAVT